MKTFDRDRAIINKALKKYLGTLKGPSVLSAAMKHVVLAGGKRLRPLLTLHSARIFNTNPKKSLPFACAIEFIHNFSLVHDDLPAMDNDDFRRGKPTCHKRFGEDIAILSGDALINLAFGILSKTNHKRGMEIISLVSEAVGTSDMIGGQALDLKRNNRLSDMKINSMKTASLMACSCEIGAILADAGKRDAKRMRLFGKNIGLAFQIGDDIEDLDHNLKSASNMRKRAGSFITEAIGYIKPYGQKADGLREIAGFVLEKANAK